MSPSVQRSVLPGSRIRQPGSRGLHPRLPAARSGKYHLIFAELELACRAELAGVGPARSPSPAMSSRVRSLTSFSRSLSAALPPAVHSRYERRFARPTARRRGAVVLDAHGGAAPYCARGRATSARVAPLSALREGAKTERWFFTARGGCQLRAPSGRSGPRRARSGGRHRPPAPTRVR
jgi:hypothetical protein